MSLYAFTYPALFLNLLDKYKVEKTQLSIVTVNNHEYVGIIKLVQQDYILFEDDTGTYVIQICAVVEVVQK